MLLGSVPEETVVHGGRKALVSDFLAAERRNRIAIPMDSTDGELHDGKSGCDDYNTCERLYSPVSRLSQLWFAAVWFRLPSWTCLLSLEGPGQEPIPSFALAY